MDWDPVMDTLQVDIREIKSKIQTSHTEVLVTGVTLQVSPGSRYSSLCCMKNRIISASILVPGSRKEGGSSSR